MPSMLWELKINYLVHEYFEVCGHIQTCPMHPENTRPDTSNEVKGFNQKLDTDTHLKSTHIPVELAVDILGTHCLTR